MSARDLFKFQMDFLVKLTCSQTIYALEQSYRRGASRFVSKFQIAGGARKMGLQAFCGVYVYRCSESGAGGSDAHAKALMWSLKCVMAVNIVSNFLRHRRRLRHFILKVGKLLICSQGGAQPIPHGHHRRAAAAADALNIIRVRHQGRPWRGAVAVLEQSVGIEHRVAGHENGGRLFVAAAVAASVEAEEADQAPDAAEQQHQEYERNRNPRDTHTDVPLADLTRDVDNRRVGQRRR